MSLMPPNSSMSIMPSAGPDQHPASEGSLPDTIVANGLLRGNDAGDDLEYSTITEDGTDMNMGSVNLIGTDGAWDIGAPAATRPGNIHATTAITSATYSAATSITSAAWIAAGTVGGTLMRGTTALGTGLGNTAGFDVNQDVPAVIAARNRTDGASNVVIASVYDRGAASITNAATMRIHSFGWTNNADAYTELAAVYADGRIVSNGINVGSGSVLGTVDSVEFTVSASDGGLGWPSYFAMDTMVPEPAMTVLLLVGGFSLIMRRRK